MVNEKVICNNLTETQALAYEIAQFLTPKSTVLLYGNVGTGKTTFCQFLIQALTKNAELVSSPTFPIMIPYSATLNNNPATIYHIDLYRINSAEELQNLDIEEIINNNLCLIEWPEKLFSVLPKNYLQINITKLAETSRQFIINTI